jgi:antitoxin MazE
MTTATLSKWGNAQGIRIPKAFCEQLGLHVGDKVSIKLEGKQLIIGESANPYSIDNLMRNWDGKPNPTPEFDWGEPMGKEIW